MSAEGDFVVTDPAPRDALYSVAEDAIELAVRPRATEPDSTTAPLEHDEPDGFAASGMARDAESPLCRTPHYEL